MYRLTPKEEVSARVRVLQRRLGRDGGDAAFLVPAEGEPVYFVRRVYERALGESAVEHIERIAKPGEIPAYFEKKKISFGTIGFEMDVMPVATFQRFSGLFPGTTAAGGSTGV